MTDRQGIGPRNAVKERGKMEQTYIQEHTQLATPALYLVGDPASTTTPITPASSILHRARGNFMDP